MIDDEDIPDSSADDEQPVPDDVTVVDPNHPESVVQCDHITCDEPSPGQDRLCDRCITIMFADAPNECPHCGTKLTAAKR